MGTHLDVEKSCEYKTKTATGPLASTILYLIGKSTDDYQLEKKMRKSELSVEVIWKPFMITFMIGKTFHLKLMRSKESDLCAHQRLNIMETKLKKVWHRSGQRSNMTMREMKKFRSFCKLLPVRPEDKTQYWKRKQKVRMKMIGHGT